MVLLADFTFKLPSARLLGRCLVPWTSLLEQLTESEEGLRALEGSAPLLTSVSTALLQKVGG
jgi:hypothetical protein